MRGRGGRIGAARLPEHEFSGFSGPRGRTPQAFVCPDSLKITAVLRERDVVETHTPTPVKGPQSNDLVSSQPKS